MRRHARTNRNPERGATLVEFALSFLLFVTMLVGLVEASRMAWTYTTLAHAARRGARFMMVHNGRNPATDAEVESVVKTFTVGLETDRVKVKPTYEDAARTGGTTAAVVVSYPFQFIASPLVFDEEDVMLTATSRTVLSE